MAFYGAGIIGVFGVLALMETRAYVAREQLELDRLERYLTRTQIVTHGVTIGVGALSLGVLFVTRSPAWSGITYFLMGPLHFAWGLTSQRHADRLYRAATS